MLYTSVAHIYTIQTEHIQTIFTMNGIQKKSRARENNRKLTQNDIEKVMLVQSISEKVFLYGTNGRTK